MSAVPCAPGKRPTPSATRRTFESPLRLDRVSRDPLARRSDTPRRRRWTYDTSRRTTIARECSLNVVYTPSPYAKQDAVRVRHERCTGRSRWPTRIEISRWYGATTIPCRVKCFQTHLNRDDPHSAAPINRNHDVRGKHSVAALSVCWKTSVFILPRRSRQGTRVFRPYGSIEMSTRPRIDSVYSLYYYSHATVCVNKGSLHRSAFAKTYSPFSWRPDSRRGRGAIQTKKTGGAQALPRGGGFFFFLTIRYRHSKYRSRNRNVIIKSLCQPKIVYNLLYFSTREGPRGQTPPLNPTTTTIRRHIMSFRAVDGRRRSLSSRDDAYTCTSLTANRLPSGSSLPDNSCRTSSCWRSWAASWTDCRRPTVAGCWTVSRGRDRRRSDCSTWPPSKWPSAWTCRSTSSSTGWKVGGVRDWSSRLFFFYYYFFSPLISITLSSRTFSRVVVWPAESPYEILDPFRARGPRQDVRRIAADPGND